jgi:hypothetical protein
MAGQEPRRRPSGDTRGLQEFRNNMGWDLVAAAKSLDEAPGQAVDDHIDGPSAGLDQVMDGLERGVGMVADNDRPTPVLNDHPVLTRWSEVTR